MKIPLLHWILTINRQSREVRITKFHQKNKLDKKFRCICFISLSHFINWKAEITAIRRNLLYKESILMCKTKEVHCNQVLANRILAFFIDKRVKTWQSTHHFLIFKNHCRKIIWKISYSCTNNSMWIRLIASAWVDQRNSLKFH